MKQKRRLALAHSQENYVRHIFDQIQSDTERLGRDGIVARNIVALRILICFGENSNRRRLPSTEQLREIVYERTEWNYSDDILQPSISYLVTLGCLAVVDEKDYKKRYRLTETGISLEALLYDVALADEVESSDTYAFVHRCFVKSVRPNR